MKLMSVEKTYLVQMTEEEIQFIAETLNRTREESAVNLARFLTNLIKGQ